MASGYGDARASHFFSRLIENSRKLLGRDRKATNDELATLASLIDEEIIPRLHMTFPTLQDTGYGLIDDKEAPEYDTEGFVDALLSEEPDNAREFINDLVDSGHSLSQIYRHLLAPSARRLGVMWEEDLCSFASVTIAITKIRHIFVATAPPFPLYTADDSEEPSSILLTTVPGEQHTFGLYLVVEIFREAGWSVWSGTPRSAQELSDLVSREQYDVVGLSVVANRNVAAAARAITNIRQNARNPDVKILVGGRIASERPEALANVGADLIISDSDGLPEITRSMLPRGRRV